MVLPEAAAEPMMRVWSDAVIPSAEWSGFPVGTFLSKCSGSQVRGFRRSAAADEARQTADPGEIHGITRSPGVLGSTDHYSRRLFAKKAPLLSETHTRNGSSLVPLQ